MTRARGAYRAGLLLFLLGLTFGVGCANKAKDSRSSAAVEALAPYNPKVTLNGEGEVVELKLEGRGVDDRALDRIQDMPALKTLSLYESSITDAALEKLKGANKLESLGLGKTKITRRGLAHLEQLPALRWLWLNEIKTLSNAEIEDFKKKAVPGITIYR